MAYSIEGALVHCDKNEECFVIGGGSIYRQFMPIADKLYITRVHRSYDADTFFPEIREEEWRLMEQEDHIDEKNKGLKFSFQIYNRA
jgi:dihydrofolate reductase